MKNVLSGYMTYMYSSFAIGIQCTLNSRQMHNLTKLIYIFTYHLTSGGRPESKKNRKGKKIERRMAGGEKSHLSKSIKRKFITIEIIWKEKTVGLQYYTICAYIVYSSGSYSNIQIAI